MELREVANKSVQTKKKRIKHPFLTIMLGWLTDWQTPNRAGPIVMLIGKKKKQEQPTFNNAIQTERG